MHSYNYEWASELFDWILLDPEMFAILMALGCVLGFAVVLWELAFYVMYRARWMAVRTLAGRRRIRLQREREHQWFVGLLRRRLARLEGQHAD